ncbi:alpha/beta hydrolase [Metaclostridioides mangenotii]|uniref:alpha/beta fold hydrolase n=1 Tax=Metaclostridioides mangenotii TaxID=1540 RepID=UPI0028EF8F78|nr:alpha/beta hydrolase [Clostridioides mangenotii]
MKVAMIRLFKLALCIFGIIIVVIAVWGITHQILTAVEGNSTPGLGDMVTVDGQKMCVYSKGEGENTIVLMSGLGTTSPILDFAPIIDRLSKKNRVIVVEPLGYGFSDLTGKERSVQNIVNEMRSALKASEIPEPYILMPHSISGIYATYYANTYPDEVQGIIGIDCTLPKQVKYFESSKNWKVPFIAKLVCPLGGSRLISIISPQTFISENKNNAYSGDNLKMQKKISAWKGFNKTVINEINCIDKNIETTFNMKFQRNLPILFFTIPPKNKVAREDGKTSISFYQTYITNESCQHVKEMNGTHYLHWSSADDMDYAIEKFLRDFIK